MLKRFFADESGQGMVEYALILALIAVVVIVAVTAIGKSAKTKFNDISANLG